MSTGHGHPTAGPPDVGARAVQRADPGEHLCAFHGSEDEQRRLATAFVARGLGAGDRVLFVTDEREPAAIGDLLAAEGLDPGELLRSGQLAVLALGSVCRSPRDTVLEAVLARYREEADRSRAAGYPGLSVALEMGDIVEKLGSLDVVTRWESVLGHALSEAGITTVCQYDARRFDASARGRIAGEHAAVAIDDGSMPLATFRATEAPGGLRVAGELDLTTAPAFARALRARAAVSRRVHVDLEGVAFADLTGLRTVYEVARELAADATIVLCRTPPALRRLLTLVGWREPRVEVRSP